MEMWMQLSAYRYAYEEEHDQEKLDWQFILRFDKETWDFEVHWCKEYEQDFSAFLAAKTLHTRKKETDKQKKDQI